MVIAHHHCRVKHEGFTNLDTSRQPVGNRHEIADVSDFENNIPACA